MFFHALGPLERVFILKGSNLSGCSFIILINRRSPSFQMIFLLIFPVLCIPVFGLRNGITAKDHNGRLGLALVNNINDNGEPMYCGGALLSEYHVLTSRLCCST